MEMNSTFQVIRQKYVGSDKNPSGACNRINDDTLIFIHQLRLESFKKDEWVMNCIAILVAGYEYKSLCLDNNFTSF